MLGLYPLAGGALASLGEEAFASSVGPAGGEPIPIRIGSLADQDKYAPTWQLLMGVPKLILLAGQTTVAFSPPPNDAHTITLDVVRNAPIPIADGDVIQIGQDVYDAILDIANATALFKEGSGQNDVAQALLARAASVAGIDLTLQQASQPSRRPLLQQTRVDEHSTARELPLVEVE